ncbi:hypothetical protein PRZ48_008999 [Zasmidium cellare]|uniref:Uncharacterized protein n=1 Tax=Zasmidium cellare TaxID=395010 RepID=A0ABR0EH13_ZASCE|nr:hypothetical protein PRZ48_008999 [Zasmidium cellare]
MAMAGFLDLPRELRDEVYQLDILSRPPIVRTDTNGTVSLTRRSRFSILCQQTRTEYEEELQKQMATLPLHHVTLDRLHARRIKVPHLPPTAKHLFLVVNIYLNTSANGKPTRPQQDMVLRDRLDKHTAKILTALRKMPQLERYIIECNIHELPCRCRRFGIGRLESILFKVLTYWGVVGAVEPRWASDWNQFSICQSCLWRRLTLESSMDGVDRAREEAIMSKEGWGVYSAKELTPSSQRRVARGGDVDKARLRYRSNWTDMIRFCRIDRGNEDHNGWVQLVEDLIVPYQHTDEKESSIQHQEPDEGDRDFMLDEFWWTLWWKLENSAGFPLIRVAFLLMIVALGLLLGLIYQKIS